MKPHWVSVSNLSPSSARVSCRKVETLLLQMLKMLKVKKGRVDVVFMSDRRIRTVNKKYLRHDYATDVIAFAYHESGPKIALLKDAVPYLGEMCVSLDTAKSSAKDLSHSFFYEVMFYVAHGLLHILGWDDKKPEDAKKMHRKQAQLLDRLGVTKE